MKKTLIQILLGLAVIASARASTPLTVGDVTLVIPGGPCWDDTLLTPFPMFASNTFTLTGVSGTGTLTSSASFIADNVREEDHVFYVYSLDLSGMALSQSHCVSLLIHFGPPLGCDYDVLLITNGTGSVDASSATLAPFGDINFQFSAGCLLPGLTATPIGMVSDTQPESGRVTVIDDYTDPGSGMTNETRVNVGAIVPDIPPDWAYVIPYQLLWPIFQGSLVTNEVPYVPPSNGIYHLNLQVLDGVNGLPVSGVVTQAVRVVNGLFSTPLPFDPNVFIGNPVWLNVGVVPPNGTNAAPLSPPLPITPTPQAIYAYSAGVVANISGGQAVTSLNGLTDGVILQAGYGLILSTNGNTLTLDSQPGAVSDRNRKTGFMAVQPEDILARLTALPIQSWRFTNEVPGVRHVGPMAQDFKAAFGLGSDDKLIAYVDEQGVALAAIQGLNQKLQKQMNDKDAEIQDLKQSVADLKKMVQALAERR